MRKTPKGTKPNTPQKGVSNKEKEVSNAAETKQSPPQTPIQPEQTTNSDKKTAADSTPAIDTKPAEKAAQSTTETAGPETTPSPKRGGGKLIGTLALLIAAGAFYTSYQQQQQAAQLHNNFAERIDSTEQTLSNIDTAVQSALNTAKEAGDIAQASQSALQALQSQSDTLTTSLSQLEAKLETSGNELGSKQATTEQKIAELKQQITELSQQLQSQQQTPDASQTDWLIAEVTQLIKMANQQAQLAGNAQAAAAALESANQRLEEINDPSLLNVRKILTDKIVALRGAPQIDITTIALTLSSLEGEADKLPLKSSAPSHYEKEPGTESDNGGGGDFTHFLDNVWRDVKGLITIKQSGEDAAPALLPPGQQFFLQQNLRLKLETARLALLQRDTELFQASIATARQWLGRYFDTNATRTANMLTTLSLYESMELTTPLPDAGDALKALEQWQSLRQQASSANTSATEAMEVAQS